MTTTHIPPDTPTPDLPDLIGPSLPDLIGPGLPDLIGPRLPTLPKRYHINPLAFFLALLLAPIIPGIVGFWLILIPTAAVIYGGPVWLALALPTLLWKLPEIGPDPAKIAILALVGNLLATAVAWVVATQIAPREARTLLVLYGGFGSVMAPIWGATFAWLYVGFLPRSQSSAIRAARRIKQEHQRMNPRHIPQEFHKSPRDQAATAT